MNTMWISQVLQMVSKPFIWWVVIATWEQAVRVRAGKCVKQLGPGIHLRIPFLDRIYVQTTRLRTTTSMGVTVTTADGKTLTVALAVEYSVRSVLRVYEVLASPDPTLRARFEGVVINYASTRSAKDLSPASLNLVLDEHSARMMQEEDLGIDNLRAFLTSCAMVRAIRLMNNDYSSSSGMHTLEPEGVTGERK